MRKVITAVIITVMSILFFTVTVVHAEEHDIKKVSIPVLALTLARHDKQIGLVVRVDIRLEHRKDQDGLRIKFQTWPGKFHPVAKGAITAAISLVAKIAKLNTKSWTVTLIFPYPKQTLFGESLSGMVAFSVIALAKGEERLPDRVFTGLIMPDGHIGKVGGLPLKIRAAHRHHYKRVLIPEELDVADGDWQNPFLMQISPMENAEKAYMALTGCPIVGPCNHETLSAPAERVSFLFPSFLYY